MSFILVKRGFLRLEKEYIIFPSLKNSTQAILNKVSILKLFIIIKSLKVIYSKISLIIKKSCFSTFKNRFYLFCKICTYL